MVKIASGAFRFPAIATRLMYVPIGLVQCVHVSANKDSGLRFNVSKLVALPKASNKLLSADCLPRDLASSG